MQVICRMLIKRIITSFLFFIVFHSLYAQIPNADFEQWIPYKEYVIQGWRKLGNAQRIETPGGGEMARISPNPGKKEPGMVMYGIYDNGAFKKGVAYKGRPDSMILVSKYHIAPGDTAWVLVILKKKGAPI